jgi:hypothetical protein
MAKRADRYVVYIPSVKDRAVYGRGGSHAYPITLADAKRAIPRNKWHKQGAIYELVPVSLASVKRAAKGGEGR